MKWDEFKSLLVGISPETPLGRIVAIRAEEDEEVLKYFTKEQMKIRSKWRNKVAKEKPKVQLMNFLDVMKDVFIQMAGGVTN